MNEMKRRVAAILEFVNRMQTERPSQRSSASGSDKDSKGGSTPNGTLGINAAIISSGLAQAVEAGLSTTLSQGSEKHFTEMAAGEMMETLTKELVQWQSLYGKHGEKWSSRTWMNLASTCWRVADQMAWIPEKRMKKITALERDGLGGHSATFNNTTFARLEGSIMRPETLASGSMYIWSAINWNFN
jgi:hypothetical protein